MHFHPLWLPSAIILMLIPARLPWMTLKSPSAFIVSVASPSDFSHSLFPYSVFFSLMLRCLFFRSRWEDRDNHRETTVCASWSRWPSRQHQGSQMKSVLALVWLPSPFNFPTSFPLFSFLQRRREEKFSLEKILVRRRFNNDFLHVKYKKTKKMQPSHSFHLGLSGYMAGLPTWRFSNKKCWVIKEK